MKKHKHKFYWLLGHSWTDTRGEEEIIGLGAKKRIIICYNLKNRYSHSYLLVIFISNKTMIHPRQYSKMLIKSMNKLRMFLFVITM